MWTTLRGGWSVNGANATTGNTLEVRGESNNTRFIQNFQTIKFFLDPTKLGTGTMNDPAMLTEHGIEHNVYPDLTLDWSNFQVENVAAWFTAQQAQGRMMPSRSLFRDYYGETEVKNYLDHKLLHTSADGNYEVGYRKMNSGIGTNVRRLIWVNLTTHQFRNAAKTITDETLNSTGSERAGDSYYGHDVTKNTLTLDGGKRYWIAGGEVRGFRGSAKENTLIVKKGTVPKTENRPYSYVAGGVTYGIGATDGASHNTVTIEGGELTGTVYGGVVSYNPDLVNSDPAYVEKMGGGAVSHNKVTVRGGTVEHIYGGAYGDLWTADAARAKVTNGDASHNEITIEGGKVKGDILGGVLGGGTGKANHNTITLGKADGTFDGDWGDARPNIFGGYSGSGDLRTGNHLHVRALGFRADYVQNFEKYTFTIKDHATHPAYSTFLTVTGAGEVDWSKVTFNLPSVITFTPSTYNKSVYTLMGTPTGVENINLTVNGTDTYTGARNHGKNGDFEWSVDTDTHRAVASKIHVEGYRFQNHTDAMYREADGTHLEAWAGRTAQGNTVKNNTLTVEGGRIYDGYDDGMAYGGLVENYKRDGSGNLLTTGDAEDNTLKIKGGAVENGYGAAVRTKDGHAKRNHVILDQNDLITTKNDALRWCPLGG